MKFSGEFCQTPDKVPVNTAAEVVTAREDPPVRDSGYRWNLTVPNNTLTTTTPAPTTLPLITLVPKDTTAGKGDTGNLKPNSNP